MRKKEEREEREEREKGGRNEGMKEKGN